MLGTVSKLISGALAFALVAGCSSSGLSNSIQKNNALTSQKVQAKSVANKGAINAKWQDDIIYFIFTDRFANGDKTNDSNVKTNNAWGYHGGDFQGIIDKLDYLKDLGTTTIWITPPMDNRDEAFKASFGDMYGYHGYWTKDFYKVDEHLGDMNKMRELVTKAHAKGIKVLIDIVMNHLDYNHEFAVNRHEKNNKYYSWFNHYGDTQDWNNLWWVQHGELAGLPDLDQTNPEVQKYLLDASKFWIKETKADGFRLDTVKHVGREFWQKFASEIHNYAGNDFMLLGEVYDGDPQVCQNYINDGLDSTFDFPFYYTIKETFAKGGSMKALGNLFAKDNIYSNPNLMSPFMDNHDVARFLHHAGNDEGKLAQAMTFLMTMRGMPMIYYGTEIGLQGGEDPENRKDMQWGKKSHLTDHLKNLTSIRKKHKALSRGAQLEMWQDDQVYAFARATSNPNETVIVAMNNSNDSQTRTMKIRTETKLQNGTVLRNLFGNNNVNLENGQITVTIKAKDAAILVVSSTK